MRTIEQIVDECLRSLIVQDTAACAAMLRVVAVEYRQDVATLAITCERTPQLLINRPFMQKVYRLGGEPGVCAVLLHELLHVALGDVVNRFPSEPLLLNIAFDMVVNAHVTRILPGSTCFFQRFYRHMPGVLRLLRPPTEDEQRAMECWGHRQSQDEDIEDVWSALYNDRSATIAEVLALCQERLTVVSTLSTVPVVGSHPPVRLPPELRERFRIDDVIRRIAPPGSGGDQSSCTFDPQRAVRAWKNTVQRVLLRFLIAGRKRSPQPDKFPSSLPVLNAHDRRAFARAQWTPLVPEVRWSDQAPQWSGGACVYFDVSGSMWDELPALVGVLLRLRRFLEMPFHAFSTEVFPARFRNGRLVTDTTGGTNITCVLKHLIERQPPKAVIITDGAVGTFDRALMNRLRGTRLYGIITARGIPAEFAAARVPYTQLQPYPTTQRCTPGAVR